MGKDGEKSLAQIAAEDITQGQGVLKKLRKRLGNLPAFAPAGIDKRGSNDYIKLAKYPLDYSPDLLASLEELDPPQEIKEEKKEE